MQRVYKFIFLGLILVSSFGCRRPFAPIKLEMIGTNEEAFLIPLISNNKTQTSTNNEAYLKDKLLNVKQIQIPQQWVPLGYETIFPNGTWKDGAVLIKVDKSPVTREWTADTATGTSNKNEAIWVMTADQVEFSTGWTITARIASTEDAITFLHNYPNGQLSNVLDGEVRAKIQSEFGIEVTDLPMEQLRKQATPHIARVVGTVEEFFKKRGISITNLGITGGFVYKNPTIQEKLVEVFNAEQEKAIAIAQTEAQKERNNKIQLEAEAEANAAKKAAEGQAEAIKTVAEAKAFEISKAVENQEVYMALKQLEIDSKRVEKWDGAFPVYYMGGNLSNLLMSIPMSEIKKKVEDKPIPAPPPSNPTSPSQ